MNMLVGLKSREDSKEVVSVGPLGEARAKSIIIMGRLKGKTTMTEQAYRYPKTSWSASQARSHCSEHGGRFEAAGGD